MGCELPGTLLKSPRVPSAIAPNAARSALSGTPAPQQRLPAGADHWTLPGVSGVGRDLGGPPPREAAKNNKEPRCGHVTA